MANNLTANPKVIDTAATIHAYPLRVRKMEWFPTTTGDDLLIVDNGGNTVWSLKAIAADTNEGIGYHGPEDTVINGIIVSTIDNGTLYIFV
jgi:hypothetical protein